MPESEPPFVAAGLEHEPVGPFELALGELGPQPGLSAELDEFAPRLEPEPVLGPQPEPGLSVVAAELAPRLGPLPEPSAVAVALGPRLEPGP